MSIVTTEVSDALAAGRKAVFVPVTEVRVGDLRLCGGAITGVRRTKSGKSIALTNALPTEFLPVDCRVAIIERMPEPASYPPGTHVQFRPHTKPACTKIVYVVDHEFTDNTGREPRTVVWIYMVEDRYRSQSDRRYRSAYVDELEPAAADHWRVVHDSRGGIHHVRRVLGDGTLLSVSTAPSRPVPSWKWGHYHDGNPVKQSKRGTYWSTREGAQAAADTYLAERNV